MRDAVSRAFRHTTAHFRIKTCAMRKLMLEIAAAALTLGAILASATGVSASDVLVKDAYARASATPVAKAGAVYVSITNQGATADRLLAVSSPVASMATLHRTIKDGDIMRMEEAGPVDLQPNETLIMEPGGLHVMLMGLKAPLKQGEVVELTLVFETAGPVTVKVPVGSAVAGTETE
jgi:periplasmic copper chaperone A